MSEITFPTAIDENVRLTLDLDTDTTTATLKSGVAILATYENNAWTPLGSGVKIGGGSDINIEEYIIQEGDALTKQANAQIGLLPEEDQNIWSSESSNFPPFGNKNQEESGETTNFSVSDIEWDNLQGQYPTDHTVFRGHYPLNQTNDEDYDYFKIVCYAHQHSFIPGKNEGFIIPDMDDRKKEFKGRVRLPMQPGISESNQVGWAEEGLNPLQVAGANIGMNLMGLDFDGAMKALEDAGNQAGKDINTQLIKSYFAGRAVGANLLGRATGQTINNNLEVLFNGPKLRTFNYQYRFTPREAEEAVMVKNIIRFFKKQMAPKRSTSRIFLKSPNVFKLKYTFKDGGSHPFLNNIKMCALSGFTVNYTPDGSYSTYSDDGRGDGSMTSYDVGLSFQEITPIYNDDYWTDQEGREGTGF